MTLMNAAPFDAARERRKRSLLIGGLIAVVLIIVLALTGFFLGHGWFFSNLPAERRVDPFLKTVEAQKYEKAYGIWMHDDAWQQHPQKYDYTFQRFKEDWTTASEYGLVKSHHVRFSRRDHNSIIVGVVINDNPDMMFLLYERTNKTLSYSPLKLEY